MNKEEAALFITKVLSASKEERHQLLTSPEIWGIVRSDNLPEIMDLIDELKEQLWQQPQN